MMSSRRSMLPRGALAPGRAMPPVACRATRGLPQGFPYNGGRTRGRRLVEHFHIPLPRQPEDLRLSRENYICTTRDGRYYFERGRLERAPEQWAAVREGALRNYDLTMAWLARLPRAGFERAIGRLPERFPELRPVDDLTRWGDVPGVYVLVLDGYKQVYVGLARGRGGIRQRIVVHWQKKMAFNRLLAGPPERSIMAIDAFRALDTTRIFAAEVGEARAEGALAGQAGEAQAGMGAAAQLERAVFDALPEPFLCNRTVAGYLPGRGSGRNCP